MQACSLQRRESGQQASARDGPQSLPLQWYDIGGGRLLGRHPHILCEYDAELRSPVGAVFINMGARRMHIGSGHACAWG